LKIQLRKGQASVRLASATKIELSKQRTDPPIVRWRDKIILGERAPKSQTDSSTSLYVDHLVLFDAKDFWFLQQNRATDVRSGPEYGG
jgi:hypothetical protein